jgi:cell division septation protein DedD
MMTSILNLEASVPPEVGPPESPEDRAPEPLTATSEYEIVLGRAQIASWLFVGVIAVAVCSSLAYLGGETIATKKAARVAAVTSPVNPVPAPVSTPAQLPQASILVPPKTDLASLVKTTHKSAPPLFADPATGAVYLQIGAVERGMAMILAEGLRNHGFDSFVAPGPNEKIFRVLIGPLPDPQAFRQAMAAVDALELAIFARKYQK